MSATDTLGHQDVRDLSATDPSRRLWIGIHTIDGVGNCPHMYRIQYVCGDNRKPITNRLLVTTGVVMSSSPLGDS